MTETPTRQQFQAMQQHVRHLYFVGIGGSGMNGIAQVLINLGYRVSGSDLSENAATGHLKAMGATIYRGHRADQIEGCDAVVVSSAISEDNPEVVAAREQRIPVVPRAEMLAELMRFRYGIAVAGTHGKTTTASMLAWILEDTGKAPGFLIGGIPANFGESARFGESEYFVVEADEYDTAFFDKRAKFVHYRPRTVILNNLEYDHADIYKDMDAILWQFHQLLRTVPGRGRIIMNGADENIRQLIDQGCWTPIETFSTADDTDWTARFGDKVAVLLSEHTGIAFTSATSKFEGLSSQDAAVETSGQLRVLAVSLTKIANDLRWMNSGPLAGIGEIALPALQPGSSIMPGKVNPVIPEEVAMVAAQVIGNDVTVTMGGQSGNFQLNVMLPVIAYNLLQSIELLSNAASALAA